MIGSNALRLSVACRMVQASEKEVKRGQEACLRLEDTLEFCQRLRGPTRYFVQQCIGFITRGPYIAFWVRNAKKTTQISIESEFLQNLPLECSKL